MGALLGAMWAALENPPPIDREGIGRAAGRALIDMPPPPKLRLAPTMLRPPPLRCASAVEYDVSKIKPTASVIEKRFIVFGLRMFCDV
jgi:hypothetical protein